MNVKKKVKYETYTLVSHTINIMTISMIFKMYIERKWMYAMHESSYKIRSVPVTEDVGDLKKLIDSIRVSHFSVVLIMFVFSSVLVSITCDVMSGMK